MTLAELQLIKTILNEIKIAREKIGIEDSRLDDAMFSIERDIKLKTIDPRKD